MKLALGNSLAMPRIGGAAAFVGALDDYTANLSAAWSVARRLLGSYSGALLRVRRSSDDAEEDIGADSFGLMCVVAETLFTKPRKEPVHYYHTGDWQG